jgi:hypothetical protein
MDWLVKLLDRPLAVGLIAFALMAVSLAAGRILGDGETAKEGESIDATRGAALTVLTVILGFSLTMAVARYDQRLTDEAAEANAIGTEFSRFVLLPGEERERAQALLRRYAQMRIGFYQSADEGRLAELAGETDRVQEALLAQLAAYSEKNPTPISALLISGLNAVIDSRGFTEAAWGNRLPIEVWFMLALFGMGANALMGAGAAGSRAVWLTPAAVAVAFFLIADIESPRRGLVAITPANLLAAVGQAGK